MAGAWPEFTIMDDTYRKSVDERAWSAFEERHLKREFFNGDSISEIAERHKRSGISIRTKLIDLGVFDPTLDQYQAFDGSNNPLLTERDLGLGSMGFKNYPRQFLTWSEDEIDFFISNYREGFLVAELAFIHQRHPLDIFGSIVSSQSIDGSKNAEPPPASDEERALRSEREEGFALFLDSVNIHLATSAYEVHSNAIYFCKEYEDWKDESKFKEMDDRIPAPPSYFTKEEEDYEPSDWEERCGGPDDSYWEEKEDHVRIDSVDEVPELIVPAIAIETEERNKEGYLKRRETEEPKYRDLFVSLFNSRFESTKLAVIEREINQDEFLPIAIIGPADLTVEEADQVPGPHGALAQKLEMFELTFSDPESLSSSD